MSFSEKAADKAPAQLPPEVEKRLLELVDASALELPLRSNTASRVLTVTGDDRHGARTLAELIRSDQALAAPRDASSELTALSFSSPDCVVTAGRESARYGDDSGNGHAGHLPDSRFCVQGFDAEVRSLFRHSLATGLYAQEIARLLRWNVEEAFLSGLLHDIGRPVLLQKLVDLHAELNCPMLPGAVETAILRLHSKVGSALVAEWALPPRLAEVILFHHEPGAAPSASRSAEVVLLANELSEFGPGTGEAAEKALRHHPLVAALNLYPDDLSKILVAQDRIMSIVESVG